MSFLAELRRLSPQALRLVAIKILSYVGLSASYFIGVLATLTYGASGDALAGTFAVGLLNLFMVLGTLTAGAVLDRVGPRRHLVFHAACAIFASVVFIALSGSIPGILVGASLFGFAWGTSDPFFRAYPAYLTDDLAELKVINAALNTAISIGVIVGPLVGSAISLVAPTWATFFFTIAMSLATLAVGLGFRPVRDPHAEAVSAEAVGRRAGDSPLAGFRTIAASGTLKLLVISGFLAFFAYGAFDPLESLYYRDVLQVGAEWMGILSSAAGVGAIFGGLIVLRLPARHVNVRTFLWCLEFCGLGCLLYVGTRNVFIALTGQVVLGVANGAFNPLQTTLVQAHAPLAEVGRVSAAVGFAYQLSGVLPLLLAPALSSVLGVQGTLVASGVCVSVVPLVVLVVLRRRIAASVEEERTLGIHVEE